MVMDSPYRWSRFDADCSCWASLLLAVAAAMGSLAPSARAQCPISLASAVSTNAGPFQWGVAVGDFNEDGRPDLAIARSITSEVIIQLAGAAPGSFLPPVAYAVGAGPGSIFAADFNGDGHLDLATANLQGDNASILRGNGGPGGTFQPVTNFPMGDGPTRLAVGDFNGDGRPDIATANDGTNNVSVRLATAGGSFGNVVNYAVGANPSGLVAADFTGDGLIDLASANLSGTVSLLRNTGAGAFAAAGTYAVAQDAIHAAAADVNLDGKMDLIIAYVAGAQAVGVLLGNATPTSTFAAPTSYAVGITPVFIATGDFNLDGRPDLAVTNFSSHTASILQGNGTSTSTFQPAVNRPAGGNPNGAVIADLNGDARPDLVVTNQGGGSFTSMVFFNTGNVPAIISQHPMNATACATGTAGFTVAAAGAGSFAYQWQIEGRPGVWQTLGNDPGPIPCGGAAFATPSNASSTSIGVRGCAGPFRVRSLVSNTCGSVASNPATLTLCVADVDDGTGTGACDGGVTIDDLLYYLDGYAQGLPRADVDDGSGAGVPDGGVTIDDLLYFLSRFEGGC